MMTRYARGMAVACLAGLVGCSTTNPTHKGAAIGAGTGAAAGAALGAIIGHQSGETGEGALLGAGLGALTGAVAGGLIGSAQQNMFCSTCGKVYTRDLAYCPDDGTALHLQGSGATPAQPAATGGSASSTSSNTQAQ